MKTLYVLTLCLLSLMPDDTQKSIDELDVKELVGNWKIDMSPQDNSDSNFAMMKITKVTGKSFKGEFYREGVKIKNAHINTQLGIIYAALTSEDNSGEYQTTFYLKEGQLHGTTHAIERGFLSVWTAKKVDSL